MSSTVLHCPACGAPDHSPDDGHGMHSCEHCGTRYRWQVGADRGEVVALEGSARPWLNLAALASVLVVSLGVGVYFMLSSSTPSPVVAEVVDGAQAGPGATVPPVMSKSVPVPPAPPSPSADLAVYGTAGGYRDSFYVLAEVTNTSPYAINKPHLTVVLRDEAGQELFQDDGYAALDILEPGQSSPVKVLVKDPPVHADFDVELSLQAASYIPELAQGLEVEALDPSVDSSGRYRVGGKVHNRGETPARFVEVLLVARDTDGAIIDLDQVYAAGKEPLAPGDAGRFTFDHLDYPRPPATWDFVVTGRVAR